MTPEKRAKIKALRQRLARLSEEERRALTARGLIATVEGRTLSLHNTLLVYLQSNGHTPTVVGGFKQWRRTGRTVKRGEHGFTIWFPVGRKDEDDETVEVEKFYTATVFDISQTDDLNAESKPTPTPAPQPAPRQPAKVRMNPADENIMEGWKLV